MIYSYKTLDEAFLASAHLDHRLYMVNKDQENHVQSMSYQELQDAAKKYAGYFQSQQIRKGDYVVLSITDLDVFFPAFWGLILIGAVAVPVAPPQSGRYINGKHDTLRLINVVKMTTPRCIFTGTSQEKSNLESVLDEEVSIFTLSESTLEAQPFVSQSLSEEATALVLFTSGSTGMPKGVEISHKKALEGCLRNIEHFGFTSEDTLLNWLPLEHIASLMLFHLLPVILKANQLQVHTGVVLQDVKRWLRYMQAYHVSASFGPNFIYRMLLQQEETIEAESLDLSSVRYIINGGEPIDYHSTKACVEMLTKKGFSRNAMIPGWGMTEIGNGGIYSHRFGDVLHHDFVAIGRSIDGLSVRLRKDDDIIDADGVEGTLEIQGSFILERYFHETPEEHAQRFTEDGWFKTGDLAVWKDDELVITGRASEIFIMNGFNFSLLEIERQIHEDLLTHQKERLIKATALKNPRTNAEELIIFVELEEMDDYEQLEHMVRQSVITHYSFAAKQIVLVPAQDFPKTGIGKVDTKTLIQCFEQGVYEKKTASEKSMDSDERTDEENVLLFIWSEALSLDKKSISVDDDFFNIGGDSAKVPGVLNKINVAFGCELNASEFVQYATIRTLLEYLHGKTVGTDESEEDEDEEIIIL